MVLSGINGTILRLLVEALYKGKVILDGITQLRQFEIALRSLHSFGILLNLRPAVYFEDENNVDDLIKEVVEDADEDGKEEVVEESKKVEISNKEAGKPVRSSKRTRKETTAASTNEEDTTPKNVAEQPLNLQRSVKNPKTKLTNLISNTLTVTY